MIIDTFPFNKDFNALEIRYEELRETVDLFVASEASYTHSGLSKELYLTNASELRTKMGAQLVVLASTKKPFTSNSRTREMLQRQRITSYLRTLNLSDSDLIIHSDCDEIPRATILKQLKSQKAPVDVILELDNYANYLNAKDGVWQRGRVQSFSRFHSIQHMRADIFIYNAEKHRRHRLPFMRLTDFWSSKRYPFNALPEFIKINELKILENSGWHFNNLIDESEIIQKIESSSHVEWNTEEIRSNAIKNYKSACDIYTGVKHQIVTIDQNYPRFVFENLDRWKPLIFELPVTNLD
jgi:beta-1,4-mannosyl-glycoprotein beta-1,4-N-acetylglucosaminyltransferase